MYIVRHCTSFTKPWIFCFFLTQTQHRDQLATLEQAIQTKEEELGELLPNYQRMKTEENECSSRWRLHFLWKLILFSIDTLSRIENTSIISMKRKKQHNDITLCKWREPPMIEFIIPVIFTPKTRNICKEYSYRAQRKARQYKTRYAWLWNEKTPN